MADGDGKRWNNYMGIPKHLIPIDGEPLIARTVRLLKEIGIKNIIITSKDERYNFAQRLPQTTRDCEIDRFEETITTEKVCFLYGDVAYTKNALKIIKDTEPKDVLFFGHEWEIFGIKINDWRLFKIHKDKIKNKYLNGEINRCIGWEIYRSMNDILLNEHRITKRYIKILDGTDDIDYPYEYEEFKQRWEKTTNGNNEI